MLVRIHSVDQQGTIASVLQSQYFGSSSEKATIPCCVTTATECVDAAMLWLSLSATQAAIVFGVTRQTIYDWRAGQTLRAHHQGRLEQVRELVKYWKTISQTPVGDAQNWFDESTGKTLLNLLSEPSIDRSAVERHLRALHTHLDKFWAEADAISAKNANDGFAPIPERWRREMRRETSGRNIGSGKQNGF
jgi:hypothetical protein